MISKFWERETGQPDAETKRQRELESRRARQSHEIALADLDDERTEVRVSRKERRADRRESRQLARLSRQARVSGARVRIAHELTNSGEIRALRVQKIRRVSLTVLLPVLAAFAAWSTLGVHAGIVKLLDVSGGPLWLGAWFVEPALGAIIGGIIVVKAALRSAGGELDYRATLIEWGALTVSVTLNLAGAWPDSGKSAAVAATVAHSIGPVGLMTTAFLISIIDDAVTNAKPFDGHPSMADPAVIVDSTLVSRPTVPPSHGTELGQRRDSDVGQVERPTREVSRPTPAPVSRPTVPSTAIEVSQPKVSHPDQYEKVVAAWESARDKGESTSVRVISASTGVPKSTVDRILKPYRVKSES